MIPEQLSIKGLYSYQELQTIDFTRLIESRLFGIFGPVGSGKSSILEAISFALFGETNRMNSNDNRNYNMMNLRSNELLIDFIFSAGNPTERYRFVTQSKRNGKQFDKVYAYKRSAYKYESNAWIPLEHTDASRILGMNRDNFHRTVIIPQGKFEEFLSLTDTKRTEMLQDIFQLDKYDLSAAVSVLNKRNLENIHQCEGALSQLKHIKKEEIDEAKRELKSMQSLLENKEKELNEYNEKLQDLAEKKKWNDELNKVRRNLEKLEAKKSEISLRETQLKDYELCLRHFKDPINRMKEIQEDLKTTMSKLESLEKEHVDLKQAFDRKEGEYKSVAVEKDKKSNWIIELADLQNIKKIAEAREEQKNINNNLDKGHAYLKSCTSKFTNAQKDIKKIQNHILKLKEALPDINLLNKQKDWLHKLMYADKQIRAKSKECENILLEQEENLKALVEALGNTWVEKLGIDIHSPNDLKTALNHLRELQIEEENRINELRKFERELIAHRKLEEVAHQLAEGDPCPVCGSHKHPNLLDADSLSKEIESNQTGLSLAERCIKDMEGMRKKIEKAQYIFEDRKKRSKILLLSIKELKNAKQKDWENQPEGTENLKLETVEHSIERFSTLSNEIEREETRMKDLSKIAEKELGQKEKAEKRIQELNEQKAKVNSRVDTLIDSLNLLSYSDESAMSMNEVEANILSLQSKINNIDKLYNNLADQLGALTKKLSECTSQIQFLKEERIKFEDRIQKLREELQQLLSEHQYEAEDAVLKILNEPIEVQLERKSILAYQQQVHTCRIQQKELIDKIGTPAFSLDAYHDWVQQVRKRAKELEEKKEECIKLKSKLEQWELQSKDKLKLERELTQWTSRGENINILKKLFNHRGFVNYISSVYLHQLCQSANERFYKMTHQRLRLELNENNQFYIRDYLNDGQLRSVKTLSGGQTFQAALCLALALAESVQAHAASKQNFFFLDEGFGSQDSDSLQLVFESLKSLRKENRIVGIISHVEAMQMEIETHLRIHNNEAKGSIIYPSWEI